MTEIRRHTVHANGIRQHFVEAGKGAPVVLLHGFPETSFAWRFQIPELAEPYRVIAPDLRGYGETDEASFGYDKRNMAKDLRALMTTLGIEKIALVGHDRGARVATRFAKDHPEAIDRLVVMDNVPTRIVAREMNAPVAKAYWFFLFHLVPDLPEALIAGREHLWLRHFFSDWRHNPLAISGEAFETYVKAYRRPGAVRGAMDDYRANAEDVAPDMADADVKIACPTLALWGADCYAVGKLFDMPQVWSEMAGDLRTHAIPQRRSAAGGTAGNRQPPAARLSRGLDRVSTLFSVPPIFALVSAGAETRPASPRGSEARRSCNGHSDGWPERDAGSHLAHPSLPGALV